MVVLSAPLPPAPTVKNMAKTQDSKKQTKKAPLKSTKEKKLAKQEKKARKGR